MRLKFMLIGLILLMFISPAAALSGMSATPGDLTGSGTVVIKNTGDTPMEYTSSIVRVFTKDGGQFTQDAKNANIQVTPAIFQLQPGQSQSVQINVISNDNNLYGVKFTSSPISDAKIKMGVNVVVKILNAPPSTAMDNIKVTTNVLPITLSGIPVNVVYNFVNTGNTKVDIGNASYYPGDSGKITQTFDNGIMNGGTLDVSTNINGVNYPSSIFVINTPMLILFILVGLGIFLRRKVDIKLK